MKTMFIASENDFIALLNVQIFLNCPSHNMLITNASEQSICFYKKLFIYMGDVSLNTIKYIYNIIQYLFFLSF